VHTLLPSPTDLTGSLQASDTVGAEVKRQTVCWLLLPPHAAAATGWGASASRASKPWMLTMRSEVSSCAAQIG